MIAQPTLDEMKTLRPDHFLRFMADGLVGLSHERWLFEQSCVRNCGGAWSEAGKANYRTLCAAAALVHAIIQEARAAQKAGETPNLALASVEAARREYLVCLAGGEADAGAK